MNPSQNLVDAFPMANGFPISDPESATTSLILMLTETRA